MTMVKMTMVILDGPMVNKFVEDTEVFTECIKKRFSMLDKNGDGVISRKDLPKGGLGEWVLALDDDAQSDEDVKKAYDSIFEEFEDESSNSIDLEKFQTMVAEIMLALARGIGGTPISMILNDGSLLLEACLQ